MGSRTSEEREPVVAIGPGGERVEGVERIAVLRGGGLGDLLFAFPALAALEAAYRGATITLLGTPMHAALLEGRPGPVHEVAVLPRVRGVYLPPGADEDPAEADAFVEAMRERRFDLAVQVHGGGGYSNAFVRRLGARVTAGLTTPEAAPLDRTVPYAYYQHEWMRALEVVGMVGARPVELEPRLQPTPDERSRAQESIPSDGAPLVVVHPGATDPRRRWPAERFATVAGRLAAAGARVVVVGDASDVPAADEIVGLARRSAPEVGPDRIRSAAGALSLSDLVGVLDAADVFLGNDSGPRHLAQALGRPTVSIFWIGNVINAGPLGRSKHRVHVSWIIRCPVCGRDCTGGAERCEHDVSFVGDVEAGPVHADVAELAGLA
ncbi:glycosyltransferase family 9 protein [Leifsonia sp. SIMBA_070]|uniref:glycosyltransferase family 9 protein n=1 Tax=Leifsonia sp. SIMBA_070 TaxID=3085810 RepID=UPI00397D978A